MAQNPSPNNNLRGRQEGPRTRIRKQNQQRVDEHHAMLAGAFVRPDPPRWVRDRRFRPVVTAARRAVPLPISRLLREGMKRLNINDKREPIDFEAFAKLRAEFTERFAHYRVGRYGNDTHEVPEEVSRLWLRPEALLPRQAQLLRRRYKLKRRDDIAPGRGYTDQDKNGVRIAVDKVMPEFKPSPMTWKRFLGAGGMGLVALFQAKNRQHETKDVIVKIPLDAGDMEQVLLDEKKYYKIYQRAQHLVQQFDFRAFLGPDIKLDQIKLLSDDYPLVFLEYAKFDNLEKCLRTSAAARVPLPDVVLWRILACLVKGLIAMEYPPYQVESTRLRSSGSLSVPDPGGKPLPEKIPLEAHRAGLRSYHVDFDLDPQNVLASEGDDLDHRNIPVFKISDFGLMNKVDHTVSKDWRWSARVAGKEPHYAPEQFCKQWDRYIDPVNEAKAQGEKLCAGDYSYKTNMWQVGMVMWCAMTLCVPQKPPIAEEVEITLPTTGEKKRIVSYGSSLKTMVDDDTRKPYWQTEEGEGYWGPQLVNTVIWMLAHYPEDRPTLDELRDTMAVLFISNQQNSAEDAKKLKEWTAVACREPPPIERPQVWAPFTIREQMPILKRFDPFRDMEGW